MSLDEITRAIQRLEARMRRIESRLNLAAQPEAEPEEDRRLPEHGGAAAGERPQHATDFVGPAEPQPPLPELVPLEPLPERPPGERPDSPLIRTAGPGTGPPVPHTPDPSETRVHAHPPPAGTSAETPTAQILRYTRAGFASPAASAVPAASAGIATPAGLPERAVPGSPKRSLELQIGMKWMAWAGAIVVVIAAGFFVKLAYDYGWLGRVPLSVRCVLLAVFGGALLAAGEVALRRIGRVASVSLFGAGLGVLYLDTLGAFRFDVIGQSGAFVLMSLVALLGFAITVRARTLTIGVLSLAGGYLSPVLLAGQTTFAAALPLYMTGLLAIGLGLSAFLPAPFRPLRYSALAFHAALATLWLLAEGQAHWLLALVSMTVWWAMATAEAAWAALRNQSPNGNAIAGLVATIWFASAGCWLIDGVQPSQRNWLGLFTLAVAAVTAPLALFMGAGLRVLSARPRDAVDKFAATLWAQVGILIATAIGLHFRGSGDSYGQSIGWLVMAAVCIEIGRRLPSRGVDVFGLIVGTLAGIRVWLFDPQIPALTGSLASFASVSITYWSLIGLAFVAVAHFMALRFRTDAARPIVPRVLATVGTLGWLALCLVQCDGGATNTAWLIGAAVLLAAERFGRRQGYLGLGQFVLVLAMLHWTVFVALENLPANTGAPTALLPFLNWQAALAVLVAAVTAWSSVLPRRTTAPHSIEPQEVVPRRWSYRADWMLILSCLFLLFAAAFEVDRLLARLESSPERQPLWSFWHARLLVWLVLWTIGALLMFVVGWRWPRSALTAGGWAITLVCGFIWLTVGTVVLRIEIGLVPATVILNLQFLAGLVITLTLAGMNWIGRRAGGGQLFSAAFVSQAGAAGNVLVIAILLWLGSLEIDRFAGTSSLSDPAMFRQTALSIFWGLFGIGLIALGFVYRSAPCRYAGLGLLAVTIAKVLIVDMKEVQAIYRVLSLLGVGLLAMGTSLAYAKLASRLLGTAPGTPVTSEDPTPPAPQ